MFSGRWEAVLLLAGDGVYFRPGSVVQGRLAEPVRVYLVLAFVLGATLLLVFSPCVSRAAVAWAFA